MKTKTTDSSPLKELLIEQLRDILWAETRLVKALAKQAKTASHPDLVDAFESHRGETQRHLDRIRQAFDLLGLKPRPKKCEAMAGLLAEAEGIAEDFEGSPALDAALICAAQKVEHYELASYGCLRSFAKTLGLTRLVDLLGQTLVEERNADRRLSEIALATANRMAAQPKP